MLNSLKALISAIVFAFAFAQAPAASAESLGQGTFVGKSNHITTGSVEIIKNSDGSHTVVLGSDFTFDGAPDPRVGFGSNGKYDKSTGMGLLQKLNGKQSYRVPAGVDPSKYNEVYIYCLRFNVPLGVAKL